MKDLQTEVEERIVALVEQHDPSLALAYRAVRELATVRALLAAPSLSSVIDKSPVLLPAPVEAAAPAQLERPTPMADQRTSPKGRKLAPRGTGCVLRNNGAFLGRVNIKGKTLRTRSCRTEEEARAHLREMIADPGAYDAAHPKQRGGKRTPRSLEKPKAKLAIEERGAAPKFSDEVVCLYPPEFRARKMAEGEGVEVYGVPLDSAVTILRLAGQWLNPVKIAEQLDLPLSKVQDVYGTSGVHIGRLQTFLSKTTIDGYLANCRAEWIKQYAKVPA